MKLVNIYILLICAFCYYLVAYGCVRNTNEFESLGSQRIIEINMDPKADTLIGTQILHEIYNIRSILMLDSLIFVGRSSEPYIKVFTPDFDLITSFGEHGRGPAQLDQTVRLQKTQFIKGNPVIHAKHRENQLIQRINLYESFVRHEVVIDTIYRTSKDLISVVDMASIPPHDQTLLIGIYRDRWYQQLDNRTGLVKWNPLTDDYTLLQIPNIYSKPFDIMFEDNLNARIAAFSPNGSRMVMAGLGIPVVEIVDMTEMQILTRMQFDKLPDNSIPLETLMDGENTYHFMSIFATDDHIYANYFGKPNNQLNPEIEFTSQIIKMDWEGNVKHQFVIPAHYSVTTISAVSSDGKSLVGINTLRDKVFSFEIPEVKD